MTPSPPTTALFDIGNVLVHLDFEALQRELVPPDTPNPAERLYSLLERKDDFETGRIPEDEFIAWASERLGFDGSPARFREVWCSIFEPIPVMWTIVSFLKSLGLRLILFSNTNAMHADWLLANYEGFSLFDEAVFSHEVGLAKPDPAIYQHAFDQYRLTPGETLYIDDLPENIESGRQLGLRSHLYDKSDHHAFSAWLDAQFGVA